MDIKKALEILAVKNKEAFVNFFETMCPLAITEGKTSFEIAGDKAIEGDFGIVGTISLSGDAKGAVSVHVSKELGISVAKALLGLATIENESDMYDCVGEITNMTAGGAKTKAESAGLKLEISCPTVIKGKPSAVVEPHKGSHICKIPFVVDGHNVLLIISVIETAD